MTPAAGVRDSVEETTRDFWSSRPRRPRHGRKIAGVAAGIGHRYGIDPVLVRVAFVVATIVGGFGVLLYLLGWLFLPQDGDEVSGTEALFGKGRSSMPAGLTIVLGLLLFPATGAAFGGGWLHGGGIVLLALAVAGLYTLHRRRGGTNRPAPVATATGASASFSVRDTDGADVDTSAPGGWDPLGADPLGWDLPEPDAAPPAPHPSAAPGAPRPRSPISGLTAGLALVTASAGLTLSLFGVEWFTAAHIIGLTLGVLGLGMVAAAFAGAGRGLVLLAIPLAAAGIALTAIPFDRLPSGGMGEIDAAPETPAEVEDVYQRTMGSVRLDLTELATADTPIETDVRVGMGEAVVTVPADADVTFRCDSAMGSVDCLDEGHEGMGTAPVSGTDYGDDGEGGQQITLNVSSRMGSVVIERD